MGTAPRAASAVSRTGRMRPVGCSGRREAQAGAAAHPPRGSLRSPVGVCGARTSQAAPDGCAAPGREHVLVLVNSRGSISLAQFGHVLSLNQSLASEGCSDLIGRTRGACPSLEPALRRPRRVSDGGARGAALDSRPPKLQDKSPWGPGGGAGRAQAWEPRPHGVRGPSGRHAVLSEGLSPAFGRSAKGTFSERIRDEGPRASGPRTRMQDRRGVHGAAGPTPPLWLLQEEAEGGVSLMFCVFSARNQFKYFRDP